MTNLVRIQRANPELAKKIDSQGYCIVENDVDALIAIDRMIPVMVRCGNGRFTCPVQDLRHFMSIIEEHSKMKEAQNHGMKIVPGTDYIRDVNITG